MANSIRYESRIDAGQLAADHELGELGQADPVWIAVAIGFSVLAIATYIALFKAVVGGDALRLRWGETYEINMAGVADLYGAEAGVRAFLAGGEILSAGARAISASASALP